MKKIIILALIPFLLITCKKKDLKIYRLEITSEEVVTTRTTAEITAQYDYPAKLERVDCFVSPTEDMGDPILVDAEISDKQFVIKLDSLNVNTQYYYCYEYCNGIDIKRTGVKSFTTKDYDLPTVTTSTVTNITAVSAKCGGNVTYDGGTNVIARGVCWGRSPNPTISGSHTTNGIGTGSFTSDLTELATNTQYYVRAYATTSKGTSYGTLQEFRTMNGLSTITTYEVTGITAVSAQCGGEVTDDGGSDVAARGVCWSTTQNPTINDPHTTDGSGIGTFSSSITGLSRDTKYYVRAYATTNESTSYGEQKEFTTMDGLPAVTTSDVTDVTAISAQCGGIVTDDGGFEITARGVCWSTNENPNINDAHTIDGNGIGAFISNLSDLSSYTVYYVRAYVTNINGTTYGEQNEFRTLFVAPEGGINGLFSVSSTQKVCFSQGDLQYQAITNTWRFAENQWDYIGSDNSNLSSNYYGWIDLFGWGTSGYNHGAVCYQPWSTSQTNSDYYAYGSYTYNLYDQTGKADWGYNTISNGGNTEHQWRTLTEDEWLFVFNNRGTISGIRYAKAIVEGVNGVILLPDDWNNNTYILNNTNTGGADFSSNIISSTDWIQIFESNGAVFMPNAGARNGTTIDIVGSHGCYWSANNYYGDIANFSYGIEFCDSYLKSIQYYRCTGRSVRLVCDVE